MEAISSHEYIMKWKNRKIVKEIKNTGSYDRWSGEKNPVCSTCPHTNIIGYASNDSLIPNIK